MKFSLINAAYILSIVHSEEICYLPLDVMFLQDTTGSFVEDLPNVLKQIPDMVHTITSDFPTSRFGVAEFKDKPYYPLGEPDDFCYKLGDGKLSGELEDFQWAYSLLYASGGGDLPEASYQALINIALDPAVGWRPIVASGARAAEGEAGARLVIMSTDAQPHLPGDIDKLDASQFPDLPRGLPKNSGGISTGDVNYECLFQDYPSPDQVKAALQSMNIYLVILTPEDPVIVPAWKWVNEELLGQPSSFYQFISPDSSDLLDGVLKAVEAVTRHACPSTTTPEPTTTTATTTISTTTEASTVVATTTFVSTSPASTSVSTLSSTSLSVSTEDEDVSPVGTTQSTEIPSTQSHECTPCAHPCNCKAPCHDNECNEGVLIRVSDRPKHVNITLA